MNFALVPQVERDSMLWMKPEDRMKPENCAAPKANKVPRESVGSLLGRTDLGTKGGGALGGLFVVYSQLHFHSCTSTVALSQLHFRSCMFCLLPLCAQSKMVNMLPIIATKGGRGGKGKLLAVPQYKTMNTDTAYRLSALDKRGREHAGVFSLQRFTGPNR